MKEKKVVRSGAPFVMAGAAVLLYALVFGAGTLMGYLLASAVGVLAFMAGKKVFPVREIEVERAPQSGNREVDELIARAREQLEEIAAANDAIAEAELSMQIEDIENTCRQILLRLEEQPQMLSSLRTFLRYYLPATLKLLTARAGIEHEVGDQTQIAAKIRAAMAQVQAAFHHQLDAMNEYRFINLESEMDALANMLRSDGLISQDEAPKQEEKKEEDPFAGLFA